MWQEACMNDFIKCEVWCHDGFVSVNKYRLDFNKMVASLTLGLFFYLQACYSKLVCVVVLLNQVCLN